MNTFKTSTGKDIPIQPVSFIELRLAESGIRAQFAERNESLDPPTYRVDLAGGGYQEFPHDATTLRTDEERALWARYLENTARFQVENTKVIQDIIFNDGVVLDLPENDAWERKQKKRFIEIPTDPDEKRLHYLYTEVLKTPEDIRGIIAEVLKISSQGSANPAAVEAALEGFRHRLPTNGESGTQTA